MRKWQLTFTGEKVFPNKPDPNVIDIEDIAHHLALENRYCGAAAWPYSVAQHSVYVARYAPPQYALEALLHDAGEYIMRDLPKPVKDSIDTKEHTRLERAWTAAAMKRFGARKYDEAHDVIKEIDTRIVLDETLALSKRPELYAVAYPQHRPLGVKIEKWGWEWAKIRFLETFDQLTHNRRWYG